jgi:secondary thiamine-phosphate synthase enzyme
VDCTPRVYQATTRVCPSGSHQASGSQCLECLERVFRAFERSPNSIFVRVGENGDVIKIEEFETKTGGRLDTLDVTEDVARVVSASGIWGGSALVFSPHTTCCVLLAKPGREMVASLERAIDSIAPDDGYYAHDDLDIRTENLVENESANAPAHIAHVFVGKASECVPVVNGELALGTDQRILFVELDCSRERRYCVQVVGE